MIEILAYQRVPKSIDHLLGLLFQRFFNTNLDNIRYSIKKHFFLSALQYHGFKHIDDESDQTDNNMFHHLINITGCLLDEVSDMLLVMDIRKKIIQKKLISIATKRRRVLFTSDL